MNPLRQLNALLRKTTGLPREEQNRQVLCFLRKLARTLDPFSLTFLVEHFRDHGSLEAELMAEVLEGELELRGQAD
jgi:hypothetical protein